MKMMIKAVRCSGGVGICSTSPCGGRDIVTSRKATDSFEPFSLRQKSNSIQLSLERTQNGSGCGSRVPAFVGDDQLKPATDPRSRSRACRILSKGLSQESESRHLSDLGKPVQGRVQFGQLAGKKTPMARLAWIDAGAPAATTVSTGATRMEYSVLNHLPRSLWTVTHISPAEAVLGRPWVGTHPQAGKDLEDLCMQCKGFRVCHLSSYFSRP
jgi:hypothetical protein